MMSGISMRRVVAKWMALLAIFGLAPLARAELIAHWNSDDIMDGVSKDQVKGRPAHLCGKVSVMGGRTGSHALMFRGKGSHVDCGNAAQHSLKSEVTVAAWITVNTFNQRWQAIVTKGDSAWWWQHADQSNYLQFACSGVLAGGIDNVIGRTDVCDGKWHRLIYWRWLIPSEYPELVSQAFSSPHEGKTPAAAFTVTKGFVYEGNWPALESLFAALLQGNFRLLTQQYPHSSYVAKAQSYLDRIRLVTR